MPKKVSLTDDQAELMEEFLLKIISGDLDSMLPVSDDKGDANGLAVGLNKFIQEVKEKYIFEATATERKDAEIRAQALQHISRLFNKDHIVTDHLYCAYQEVKEIVPIEHFCICSYDHYKQTLLHLFLGSKDEIQELNSTPFPADINPIISQLIASKDPILSIDENSVCFPVEGKENGGPSKTIFGVPLINNDLTVGIFILQFEDPNFTLEQKDQDFLVVAGELIGSLIERNQVQISLQESEKKYRTLLNSNPDVIFRISKNGDYLDFHANPEILILPKESFQGTNIKDTLSPEQAKECSGLIEKALETDEVQMFYHDLLIENRHYYFEGRIVKSSDDEVLHIVRDVTEESEREEALRQSKLQNEAMLNAIPDLLFRLNEKGIFIDYNVSGAGDSYSSPSEYIGKSYNDVLPPNVASKLRNAIEKTKSTGGVSEFEHELDVGDEIWYYEARITACGNNELLGIVRNITRQHKTEQSLKESEEKYRNLFQKMHEGLLFSSPEGIVEMTNPRLEKILGYSKGELIGKNDKDFIVDKKHGKSTRFAQNDKKYNISERYETWLLKKSGESVWVNISTSPHLDREGKYLGEMSIIKDISERKTVELMKTLAYNIATKSSSANIDTREFCAYIQEQLGRLMDVSEFYISEVSGPDTISFLYLSSRHGENIEPFSRKKGNGLSEFIIETGRPLLLSGKDTLEFQKKHGMTIHGETAKSWLGAPIMLDGKSIGVVVCQSFSDGEKYNGTHLELLTLVGNQISLWIERKKVDDYQRSLLSVFENSKNEIYVFDVDTLHFTYVNEGACQNLGYTKEEILKLTPVDIKDEFNNRTFRETIAPLKSGDVSILRFETFHRRKDKTIYPVEVHLQHSIFRGTESFVATIMDISERREKENEIKQSYTELLLIDTINRASAQNYSLSELTSLTMKNYETLTPMIGGRMYLFNKANRALDLVEESIKSDLKKKIEKAIGIGIKSVVPVLKKGSSFSRVIETRETIVATDQKEIKKIIGEHTTNVVLRKFVSAVQAIVKIKTFIIIPLVSNEGIFGLVTLTMDHLIEDAQIERIKRYSNGITAALIKSFVEEELSRQRKFMDDVLNNISSDIAVFNKKHQYLFINQNGVRDSNMRDWLIGKTDFDYCELKGIDDSLAKRRRKYFDQALIGGGGTAWIDGSLTEDKEEWIMRKFYPVMEGEEIKYIIGYGVDITNRVIAEKKHKELASIVAHSRDAIVSMTLDGYLISWNDSAMKLFGYTHAEITGKSVDILTPKDKKEESREFIESAIAERSENTFETVRLHKSGHEVNVEISIFTLTNESNNVTGISAIIRDITSRKAAESALIKSEGLLKDAQRVANIGSWQLEVATGAFACSDEFYRLVGFEEDRSKLTFESYLERIHPDDRESVDRTIHQSTETKESYKFTHRLLPNEGIQGLIFIECRGNLDIENGEVIRLNGTAMDITERMAAEKVKEEFTLQLENQVQERTEKLMISQGKLKVALAKEQELGKLKSEFVSIASHQFRTPMAIIQSNTELLNMIIDKGEGLQKAKLERSTARITKEIKRMTDLMNEVLVLGKATSGQLNVDIQLTDVEELCRDLTEQYDAIQKDGRTIEYSSKGVQQNLMIDAQLINHAIGNVISNAFKYSKEKNPKLELSYEENFLKLKISDYGMGIPKHELNKLYQPFRRAENVRDIEGTGLGLTISKEYIELNGGTIEVESVVDFGTTFTIMLPYI